MHLGVPGRAGHPSRVFFSNPGSYHQSLGEGSVVLTVLQTSQHFLSRYSSNSVLLMGI